MLIFDEVFVGFRLAPGGAQEYFGVRADMVTYGKTLGGGLPVGVVCGRAALMRRFREDRPADVCFARGTFNSHPYVMGAMHEFLRAPGASEPCSALYRDLDALWNARAARAQRAPRGRGAAGARGQPVLDLDGRLHARRRGTTGCSSTICAPHGLALSWVGTGRFIFSLNYTDADFAGSRRADRGGGARHGARRLVVVRSDASPTARSGAACCAKCFRPGGAALRPPHPRHIIHRVDELAAQQRQRRAVVEHHIVERVGDDLGDPHQAGLHVADEEQLHGAEQQAADARPLSHMMPTWLMNSADVVGAWNRPNSVGLNHSTRRG